MGYTHNMRVAHHLPPDLVYIISRPHILYGYTVARGVRERCRCVCLCVCLSSLRGSGERTYLLYRVTLLRRIDAA